MVDSRISMSNILGRNLKQFEVIQSKEDFRKVLDTMEFLYKSDPLSFVEMRNTCRGLVLALFNLLDKTQLPLSDMVRMATILTPSTTTPTFLFKDICRCEESFNQLDKHILKDFVDVILGRIKQHEVSFDHLKQSISVIHRHFVPYSGKTFQVLNKIITDLGKEDASSQDLQIIFTILAEE